MPAQTRGRFDVYRAVTDSIIKALEVGTGTSECPWHRDSANGLPTNALTEKRYRGVNVVALWASATISGHASNLWATYRQWQRLGAHVRRGERSSMIVFYKQQDVETEDRETGKKRTVTRLVARASRVFNADQVEGFTAPEESRPDLVERIAAVEQFVQGTRADIRHGGNSAYYSPAKDRIVMPYSTAFIGTATSSSTESYYGVLLHELVHWTGASHRLARDLAPRFKQAAYAMEELVAELGAAFLCSQLKITSTPRADHAGYIASWLDVLKSDKRAIFSAASKASQAADYLTEMQT